MSALDNGSNLEKKATVLVIPIPNKPTKVDAITERGSCMNAKKPGVSNGYYRSSTVPLEIGRLKLSLGSSKEVTDESTSSVSLEDGVKTLHMNVDWHGDNLVLNKRNSGLQSPLRSTKQLPIAVRSIRYGHTSVDL